MKPMLVHKDYEVWRHQIGRELWATIQTPRRRITIAEVPAVPLEAGEGALKALAKAAIERDLKTRR